MFLAALDQTVMSTAALTISHHFANVSGQAWLLSSYLLASLITTPIYGRLSDGWGRRPLFVAALVLFGLGSAMAALSPTFFLLIAGRSVQGLGAGGLFSLAFAVISDVIPPRERGRYILVFVAVFGSASILGPVIGGFIASQTLILGIAGWRWIFILNLPIVLFAIYRAMKYLKIDRVLVRKKLDWQGVILLGLFLLTLLVSVQPGASALDSWRLSLIVLAITSFLTFIYVELHKTVNALVPLSFFKSRLFTITIITSGINGTTMLVALLATPLSIQIVEGKSPSVAGAILLSMGFGNLIGSGLAGRFLARSGYYRWLATSGAASLAIGFAVLAISARLVFVVVGLVFIGFGSGLVNQFTSIAAPHALGSAHRGSGSALSTFARQLGGVLGSALSLAAIFFLWRSPNGISASAFVNGVSSLRNLTTFQQGNFVSAVRSVYLVCFGILILTTLLTTRIDNEQLLKEERS
jgi:MFS family permease